MALENINNIDTNDGLKNTIDNQLITLLGKEDFDVVKDLIKDKELFLKLSLSNSRFIDELKENIITSPFGEKEIDKNIFDQILSKYQIETKTDQIETKTDQIETKIYNFIEIINKDTLEFYKLFNNIEQKTGKKISELFSSKELEEAEKEVGNISKDSPNYEARLYSVLINKYSDRLLLEYPSIEEDVQKIKDISKKMFRDIEDIRIPISSKSQLIHSNTLDGDFLYSDNVIQNGDQYFIIDEKTGTVKKYLGNENATYLIDTTIEFPTDYEYKRERIKIQKETKKLSTEYNSYKEPLENIAKSKTAKIKEYNTLDLSIEGNDIVKLTLESEIKEFEQEEKRIVERMEEIALRINELISKSNEIENKEINRVSNYKEKQKEKDEKIRKMHKFLSSIGFDLIPQSITDQIINTLNSDNSLRSLLGFNEEINIAEGSLGLQKDNDRNEIGVEEKAIFAEFVNIMILGEKGRPINIDAIRGGTGVGVSDRSQFQTILKDTGVNDINGNVVIIKNLETFLVNESKSKQESVGAKQWKHTEEVINSDR